MKELSKIINTLMNDVDISLNQALHIIDPFFSSFEQAEDTLKTYIEQKDFKSIAQYAHQLKGTTANLRIAEVSEKASSLENSAKDNDIESCKQYIKNITDDILSLKDQMKIYDNIRNLNILIVEDNDISGKILEQMILNLGHNSIGISSSPEEALLAVKEHLPDMIFMDIDLSSAMNGIYTAELLSSHYSIPIVFVSAHAESEYIKQTQEFGVGYIVKPFTPKEVEDMIKLVCSNILNDQEEDTSKQPKIRVKEDNRVFFVNLSDIICFEARAHTIMVYTEQNVFQLTNSLKKIKELDKHDDFIQPHRSFLINRNYIHELQNDNSAYQIKLKGLDMPIPISKNNLQNIKSIFSSL